MECARKKVVKQANIDEDQANFSWEKSDLCVYFTEDSKDDSKEESKVYPLLVVHLRSLSPP